MAKREKGKLLPMGIGVGIALAMALFIYLQPLGRAIHFLENGFYDFVLKHSLRPLSKNSPILIIDIDDKSLANEGRWPWPREKLADLIAKLYGLGAKVIALDITFPEPEAFNSDDIFASSLKLGDSILGFVFKSDGEVVGALPLSLLTLPREEQLGIPSLEGYLGNIKLLQQSAYGGFLNSTPDSDGILRVSPLLLGHKNGLYPSLGLQAALVYLQNKRVRLVSRQYRDAFVLEGIELDQWTVPTDPQGRVLIPFRGPPYSVPTVSATDVLQGKVAASTIAKRLLFVGFSATAMGDLVATAIAPAYPGVEVHADIASGILQHDLLSRPAWDKGVSVALIIALGIFFALTLPFLAPIGASLLAVAVPVALLAVCRWIWVSDGLVIPVIFPILTLLFLYLFNLIWSSVFERKNRQKMISIFGEYVPPERIESMLKMGEEFSLEGEAKEITVLFADIRHFTALAESLPPNDVKKLLNEYLTPMTQVIFDHKGTIDKYVGDMIMAFWGAPLENQHNALDAVRAALDMQKELQNVNARFVKEQKPEIHIGVGVNTGIMNVGDMGSKFRRAYTVIGDAVDLASRLEGVCRYYDVRVIVGEETYQRTRSAFGYRKLDRIRVKGKKQAIDIYEPLCTIEACGAETVALLEMHNRAIGAYFQQKWEEAEAFFRKLAFTDPSGKNLYSIYLSRIEAFRKNPPGAGWDSVYTFDTK